MIKAVQLGHTFTRKPNLADVKAAGHDMLRLVNRRILLNILSDRQPISRAEIAKISGLNKGTISTITSELLKDSCIIEEGSGRTTPIGESRQHPYVLTVYVTVFLAWMFARMRPSWR